MPRAHSNDGTTIAYDLGGHGPALILVDGAMAHRGYMGSRQLAEELTRYFSVVSYDRRGRGESTDTTPYAVEREIEDLDRLIDAVGAPVGLYGFSSGAVLALRAAAALGEKVGKLALHEPPFHSGDEQASQEFAAFADQMSWLLREGRSGDAVTLFLSGMLPPDMLERMKQGPEWPAMEAVAHTLDYDNAVMGNGAVPLEAARAVTVDTLVLDGSESPPFKHEAAEALARALPRGRRKTFEGHMTLVPPDVLAPELEAFFRSTSG